MTERVVTNHATDEERGQENVLRPQTLDEYVGQDKMKESLRICIEAAKQREEALDHAIFYGPPGLGKTTTRLLCNVCPWGQICWACADPVLTAMSKSEVHRFLLGAGAKTVAG